MNALAIEVHDADLRAVRSVPGDPVSVGPGYALFERDRLITGLAARGRARLSPRLTHSSFWEQLDTQPLARPYPDGFSKADLAHAHLQTLWDRVRGARQVVLVVPSGWSESVLSLLLGIAGSLEMPVAVVVDAAVAAGASVPSAEADMLHLDLRLHRAELTRLRQDDDVVRESVWSGDGWGMVEVFDLLARRASEAFVRTTRFDPLHLASTEQALHDALPGWLMRLRDEERVEVELEGGGRTCTLELRRPAVHGWVEAHVRELCEQVDAQRPPDRLRRVLLTETARVIPGLEDGLRELPATRVEPLVPGAAARAALSALDLVAGAERGGLVLVRRMPLAGRATRLPPPALSPPSETPPGHPRAAAPPPAAVPAAAAPTHLLLADRAYRIGATPLVLGAAPGDGQRALALPVPGLRAEECRVYEADGRVVVEDVGGSGCYVNGARVAGEASLAAGDRLGVGKPGIVLVLVREADS